MKTLFLFMIITGLNLFAANAAIITVDNNVGSAAQYTDLQTAINAAQNGDTILVAASPAGYGHAELKKTIRLIGEGYKGNASIINYIQFSRTNASLSASGSFVSGFRTLGLGFSSNYSGMPSTNSYISDIAIERCEIRSNMNFISDKYSKYSNISIKNNLFIDGYISFGGSGTPHSLFPFTNVKFENNIFSNYNIYSSVKHATNLGVPYIEYYNSTSGVSISNNLFLSRASGIFNSILGANVENNIFYATEPISIDIYQIEDIYDSLRVYLNFNNNLQYYSTQDITSSGSGVGSDNQNADPLFENFPLDGASFSYDHDYHLKAGSPAISAGVNSEDLGIYGGNFPFESGLKPRGPQMTSIKVVGSPSVPAGGTIQVNFSATVQD